MTSGYWLVEILKRTYKRLLSLLMKGYIFKSESNAIWPLECFCHIPEADNMVLEGICTMVQMLSVLVRPYKSEKNFKRTSGKPWFTFAMLMNSWFVTWTLKMHNKQRWGPLLRTCSFQELEGSSKSSCKKKRCQSGQHLALWNRYNSC